ncbi:meiotic recombination protein SPO11-1 [Trichogramma pretiosum]|uniref:meiotic recombination protein SPO11-1 n=1 Tax=Trichogramma pretiosum TaxID=7493 RepID=UPI0006C9C4DF|nr:meiotic recombination protein SPO11-1 [Trichogramma pretiosum]
MAGFRNSNVVMEFSDEGNSNSCDSLMSCGSYANNTATATNYDAELLVEKFADISIRDFRTRRCFLVKRIEDLARELVTDIAQQKVPSFEYDDGRNSGWSSCSSGYHSTGDARERRIRFNGNAGRQRFTLLLHILNDAHRNLVNYLDKTDDAFYRTKRALFYMMKNEPIKRFVKKQAKVEWGIKNVTLLLDCSPWEIGYISTSKGLIAGDLTLHLKNPDRVIQFEQQTCRAVPDVVANICHIRTTAEFVLVVEKDSVFQKLKSEDCPKYNNCILVTGKGYPDIPTRMFVSLLSSKLKLPVYALVDANPYGFEIMCVYRFGTTNNLGYREQLLCPDMKWIGVHQHDLVKLGITRIKLTKNDLKKIRDLQNRSYIDQDFSKQLMEMRLGKAEIESVNKPAYHRFLTQYYIPMKIRHKKYF